MNQISKQIFANGSALDLRGDKPSSTAANPQDFLTKACVSAIDDAVDHLRKLTREAPLSYPHEVEVGETFAEEKVDEVQAVMPTERSERRLSGDDIPVVDTVGPETKPRPAEELRETPGIEARRTPDGTGELKAKPDIPFAKTIDGDTGPVKENERRLRTDGGGGGGKEPDFGGGGGGGGGGNSGFHKRSEPVNFALSLARGIAAIRRNLAIVMVFTVAINVLLLAIPLYLFQISDRVLTSRSIDTLVMLSIVVVGAVLLQAFLDSVRRFILMRTAVELEVQLGAPILSAAARASLHGNGKDYQILQDLQLLRSFLTSGTLIAFLDAPLMPLFVVVVYLVHPHLGIIIMICCAVLFLIAYLNQKFTAKQFAESNSYLSRANFHLDSMSRNSQIINALAMIPEAVKMWGRETAGSLKSHVEAQDRNIIFTGISKACRMITQVGLLGWGAHLSLSGELTGGMVIAASIISGRALAPIEGAIEGWHQFNRSAAAYGRIKNLLLTSPLNFPRLRLPNPEGRLDVERILFVPPPQKKVILNGISFSLRKGESLAIIGNSGSGKTTLGKMLVGSILPTSGNVRLDLMDLRNWDQRQFGESIGYLPQDVQLFPGTIKANICRMRDDIEDRRIYEAAVLADVHELIAGFPQGYETVVAADGAPLSGGQKQRIALARAFFGDPKFVVLDEPNSNLDTQGEAALAKALIHAKKQGITTVTITQRPALLQCVDKIMVLKDGTVAMFGERMEVLQALSKGNGRNGQQTPRIER
ncbi:ATP-binding cassette subfamily C protein [Rhizobium sp. BK316]|uniref:type I secretion system permease/ATPase n=1 Tax=Rhizobium sp. BK316 TaxID=2587053 RepID=UPI00162000AB|nr:type I secretion system permease/ATPase [Rhizobium sp. BK316]MBB3412355.1 ATP-binding cassette subfamily C protein [Rhizobium sp. BK316]